MMRTVRLALATTLLGVVAVGCAGDPTGDVTTAFKGYHTALLARDFATACGYNAPEATAFFLQTLASRGVQASTCEDAFTAIFEQSGAADVSDTISRSATVDEVEVDGSDATLTYTSTVDGEPKTASVNMRRIDGAWKFVAPG